ncbi:MAG: thioredoxin family protein [Candidatus Micrarchaeota archaeon]|nr:thioredoxin family protein [Candidatus Micrarchaeota archaeon]
MAVKSIRKIEILGMGCASCKRLEENVRKAVSELGLKVEILKVTEIEKIVERGVMATPALAFDGNVVSSGRVPDVAELKKWMV